MKTVEPKHHPVNALDGPRGQATTRLTPSSLGDVPDQGWETVHCNKIVRFLCQ